MTWMLRTAYSLVATLFALWAILSPAIAQPAASIAEHFRGKTIKLMIATGTGGAYGGYCADITHTFFVQEVSENDRNLDLSGLLDLLEQSSKALGEIGVRYV